MDAHELERHQRLMDEAHYAERVCARTGRLYRSLGNLALAGAALGLLALVAGCWPQTTAMVPAAGLALLAAWIVVSLTVRPATKAAASTQDAQRYAAARTVMRDLTAEFAEPFLAHVHAKASRQQLRAVSVLAWDDFLIETRRFPSWPRLSWSQRLLAVIA